MWSTRDGAEIVANGLQRIVERFRDSAEIGCAWARARATRLISGETPTNASPDAGQVAGAGVTSLQGRYPLRALASGTRSTPV